MDRAEYKLPNHPIVHKAIEMATKAHKGQFRKAFPDTPYIVHPIETAEMLFAHSEYGSDPRNIAAAILHDTVEDCDYDLEHFTLAFGEQDGQYIYNIVLNLSVPQSVKNSEKKDEWQQNKMSILSPVEQHIKLADRCASNVRSMIFRPPTSWSIEKRLGYIGSSKELLAHSTEKESHIGRISAELCNVAEQRVHQINDQKTNFFHIVLPRNVKALFSRAAVFTL